MKILLGAYLSVLALAGLAIGYTRLRDAIFRQGYERGTIHEADFILRTQPALRGIVKFPSTAFRDCAWRYVNEDENSGWIELCQREAGRRGIISITDGTAATDCLADDLRWAGMCRKKAGVQ